MGTRHADRPLDDSAQSQALHYFTSQFNPLMGKFNGEAWVDDTGLSIKSTLRMPFGVVTAALDASP